MKIPALAAGVAVTVAATLWTVGPVAGPDPTAPAAEAVTTAGPTVARATGFTGKTVKMRLRRAVTKLPVAAEERRGYDREKFQHWIDANGDCQDTREEVLDVESVTEASGCGITTGEWKSYYALTPSWRCSWPRRAGGCTRVRRLSTSTVSGLRMRVCRSGLA